LTLDEWLERIERLHHRPIDLTLERSREVARRLGIDLRPAVVFTVGGTNGKGSTCAMLDAVLRADGYRVGLYTSPHLLHFNERVRINGKVATDAALIEQFEAVEVARQGTSLTFFEFSTLASLRLFQQSRLDAVVLEVGLGGRLDTVNIVDSDCAVVTSIDLDHQELLGSTREQIGFEKAHIFRAGRPAICAEQKPPQALLDVAAGIGADLRLIGRDFTFEGDRTQWNFAGRAVRRNSLPYPALRGACQVANAAAALAALEACAERLPLSQKAVREGLLTVEIAARFQVLPGRPSVILDVAHNPAAAAVLARNLDSMGFFPVTHAVFGMLRDKDISGAIAQVAPRVDRWYVGTTPGPRGSDGEDLAHRVRAAGLARGASVAAFDSIAKAYHCAIQRAQPEDRIVVFGSFLTVAEVLNQRTSIQRT
jgi:dihydrofolate synthase/folylpolyglutamate synthase